MRYTEYHAGKAVIKDRSLLAEAMEKLAKLEDKEEMAVGFHVVRGCLRNKPMFL